MAQDTQANAEKSGNGMKKNILLRTNLLICVVIIAGFLMTAVLSYRANYSASLENIELANQMKKDSMDAGEILKLVGLSHRSSNFPGQLSGGEQQRVAIARAIAKKPKLLLCDEPTGALDDQSGRMVLELLQKLSRQEGMTVLIITHNAAIAQMADRIIRFKNGTVSEMVRNTPLPSSEIAG